MAYDSTRGATVLFGGGTFGSNYRESWGWNGTAWAQLAVSGPSPQSGHAMAYDSARGVTVLFAGGGETWEWSGSAWTQRAVSGPSPRSYLAMAYDAARGVTVLFGGTTGGGETWEWNGSAWTQRAVSGPSARYGHEMAFDSSRGVTFFSEALPAAVKPGNGMGPLGPSEWPAALGSVRPCDGVRLGPPRDSPFRGNLRRR